MSLEVFTQANAWRAGGRPVVLATVTQTGGSSPRPLGSVMAINDEGCFVGSVSGGCIEGAVIEEAVALLSQRTGSPKRLNYGIADEEAWAVGLSCGGDIGVVLELLPPERSTQDWLTPLRKALASERSTTSVLIVQSTNADVEASGWPGGRGLRLASDHRADSEGNEDGGSPLTDDRQLRFFASRPDADRMPPTQLEGWLQLSDGTHHENGFEVFVQHFEPPPKLVIVGAVHIAEHLVHFAQRLGFHCVVIDAREAFATTERFQHADQLIVEWPSEAMRKLPIRETTYCAFLTHDPKFDDDAIKVALGANARYVGALGSKRTHAKRKERLHALGVDASQLDRIDAPIGLDLGGRKPEEIALSIAAKLVLERARTGVQPVPSSEPQATR